MLSYTAAKVFFKYIDYFNFSDYRMPVEGPESCGLCKKNKKQNCKKEKKKSKWLGKVCKNGKRLCKKFHPKLKSEGKCAGE